MFKRRLILILWSAACILLVPPVLAATEQDHGFPPVVRGSGAVFLALEEEGPITLEISKQDLNNRSRTRANLYAWLLTPDREVVAQIDLQDDDLPEGSGRGPVTTAIIETAPLPAGIYKLYIVTTGFDGQDNEVVWGMRSSVERYMVIGSEHPGSRGDTPVRIMAAEQEEGIAIYLPGLSRPQTLELDNLSEATGTLTVVDAAGGVLLEHKLSGKPKERLQLPRTEEGGLIGLHFPAGDYSLALNEFTRWGRWGGFNFEKHSVWTFEPGAYFPIQTIRWAPYSRYVILNAQDSEGHFDLYNSSATDPLQVEVSLESSDPAAVEIDFPAGNYWIEPETMLSLPVSVNAAIAEALQSEQNYRLRVDFPADPGLTTYATLVVAPPRELKELQLPMVLQPFQNERRTHNYHPLYPINEVQFSPDNQPWIRDPADRYLAKGIYTMDANGEWQLIDFLAGLEAAVEGFSGTNMGGTFRPVRTAFDGEGGVYSVVNALDSSGRASESVATLLFQPSPDAQMEAYPLTEPDFSVVDIEYFTGHNHERHPPAVVVYSRLDDPGLQWGYRNQLELIIPERNGDQLDVSNRHLITNNAISLCTHSGAGATVVSVGDKVHVVWGEVAEGAEARVFPGVPTFIATYDRTTATMGEPVRIGFAPPVNDMHNSPGITVDSKGILHVVLGAHARFPFHYTRSRQPNDAYAGWTNPVKVLHTGMKRGGVGPDESGAQTYVGLVCDQADNLHLVFRHDLIDMEGPFPGFNERYRALSHQVKPAGEEWQDATVLIVPPLPNYSVYYHKLTIDRNGRLFLFHSYRPGDSVMRSDLTGGNNNPALWVSEDNGKSWRLTENEDFAWPR